jgi:hypothetical protein
MGRKFPKGKLLFEDQCAAIPNALTIEERHLAPKNAAGDSKHRQRVADLHFDARARQQPPVGFYQCASGRQINDDRGAPGPQPRPIHAFHRAREDTG